MDIELADKTIRSADKRGRGIAQKAFARCELADEYGMPHTVSDDDLRKAIVNKLVANGKKETAAASIADILITGCPVPKNSKFVDAVHSLWVNMIQIRMRGENEMWALNGIHDLVYG